MGTLALHQLGHQWRDSCCQLALWVDGLKAMHGEGKPLLGTVLNTVVRGPRHRLAPQAATIEWPEKGNWSGGGGRLKVLVT